MEKKMMMSPSAVIAEDKADSVNVLNLPCVN